MFLRCEKRRLFERRASKTNIAPMENNARATVLRTTVQSDITLFPPH